MRAKNSGIQKSTFQTKKYLKIPFCITTAMGPAGPKGVKSGTRAPRSRDPTGPATLENWDPKGPSFRKKMDIYGQFSSFFVDFCVERLGTRCRARHAVWADVGTWSNHGFSSLLLSQTTQKIKSQAPLSSPLLRRMASGFPMCVHELRPGAQFSR